MCYNAGKPPQNYSNLESENTLSQTVVNCPRCARKTPAVRALCLYCGEPLPVTKIETAPEQRAIDSNELAFNTVLEPVAGTLMGRSESALASALKLTSAEVSTFIESRKPVPLARCQSRQEAEMIAELVRTCGMGAVVVADEELQLNSDLIRAKRIIHTADGIQVQHSDGALGVSASEIKLLVVGRLRNTRVDFTESKAGMRSRASTVLDTAEFFSEETLLDVYASNLGQSFRIKSDGFDYSGIVSPLSFRTEVNFGGLIDALHAVAPAAIIDHDFAECSHLYSRAWPERSRTESGGVKRTGLAYRPVSKSSVIKDNRDQFERYSRLMFIFNARSKL